MQNARGVPEGRLANRPRGLHPQAEAPERAARRCEAGARSESFGLLMMMLNLRGPGPERRLPCGKCGKGRAIRASGGAAADKPVRRTVRAFHAFRISPDPPARNVTRQRWKTKRTAAIHGRKAAELGNPSLQYTVNPNTNGRYGPWQCIIRRTPVES